jgi:hypothetical protein
MRRLLILLLLLIAATTHAGALEIRSYDVLLTTSEDGSAAGVTAVRFGGRPDGPLTFPLGFRDVTNVRITVAPAPALVSAANVDGQSVVSVTFPNGAPADPAIEISFDVPRAFVDLTPAPGEKSALPAGAMLFRHALINTAAQPIAKYEARIALPPSMRVHAIREALPKLTKKESEPRVRLLEIAGRNGARLRAANLTQGGSTSMQLELVPQRRPWGWLLAGIALSLFYLVSFRDLVARQKG